VVFCRATRQGRPSRCRHRAPAAAPSPPAAGRRSNCWLPARTAGTEALLIAHGFTIAQMVELVRAGLATAAAERVVGGAHVRDWGR